MRQAWIVAIGLMTAMGVARAEEAGKQAPRIVCDEPTYDFGTVQNQEAIEHVFLLKNEGTATLEISGAKSFCGCTVASISDTNVPPGGTSKVTAKLSLAGRYGALDKKVSVESNDPAKPSFMLALRGTVFSPIDVSPDRVTFSPTPPGTTSTSEVVLAAAGTNVFKVTQVKSSSPAFLAETATVEDGKKYKIIVRTALGGQQGYVNGQVTVTTDHPSRQSILIPLSAAVLGEIMVYPGEIVIAMSGTGPVVRAINLKPGTAPPFEVVSVEPPSKDMKVQVLPYMDKGHRIVIENIVPDASLAGKSVKITTSSEKMKEIVVPFRLLGLPAQPKAPAATAPQ
jgi:hypothetical protein